MAPLCRMIFTVFHDVSFFFFFFPMTFNWRLNCLFPQWWTTWGLEDLHATPPPDRQRKTKTYSLQVWKVRRALSVRRGRRVRGRIIQSFKRLCCLSAAARLKQTTCQREWVFTTPALTSGSTLTGCERRRARVGGRRSAAGTVSPVWFWYCFTVILRSPLTQPWAFFTDILFLSHSFIHPLSSWTKFDGGDGGRGGRGGEDFMNRLRVVVVIN